MYIEPKSFRNKIANNQPESEQHNLQQRNQIILIEARFLLWKRPSKDIIDRPRPKVSSTSLVARTDFFPSPAETLQDNDDRQQEGDNSRQMWDGSGGSPFCSPSGFSFFPVFQPWLTQKARQA